MIDATKVGSSPSHQRRRSKARIEGMDQLNKNDHNKDNIGGEYAEMTDAERQMREEELSFYSASDNDHGDDNIWGLLSGVGGNIYEWYVSAVVAVLVEGFESFMVQQNSTIVGWLIGCLPASCSMYGTWLPGSNRCIRVPSFVTIA